MSALWLLLSLSACSGDKSGGEEAESPEASPAAATVEQADALVKKADFEGAAPLYEQALAADPTSVDAAVGRAYIAALSGDFDGADRLLGAVSASAGARVGEVELRRALLAGMKGDLEAVRRRGEASGLPAGQLLAAEAALADADQDAAKALLQKLALDSSEVGEVAGRYLEFLDDADPSVAALAENYALWSLGQRNVAVRSVGPLIRAISESDWKNQELLLWAGRAAAIGEPQAASDLLESIAFAPKGQSWRVRATRAMIRCAEQDVQGCLDGFEQLEGKAPPVGLLHARATAAMTLDKTHRDAAVKLLDQRVSAATARAALEIGDLELAGALAPEGLLADFIKMR